MAPREVTHLQERLSAMAKAAVGLAAQLEDLHALAHDRAASGGDVVSGRRWPPPGVETHGDDRAKDLWRRLQRIPAMEVELLALERAVGNLLSEGSSAEETRGSLVTRREYHAALRNQRARKAAGEYVPKRNEDQPDYPGGKRS